MDINNLNINYKNIDILNTQKNDVEANKKSSLDFFRLLTEAVGEVNGSQSEYAPVQDSWSANPFGIGSVEQAVSFLSENYGIEADSRTPTYEITGEQYDWLSNRHDLSGLPGLNTHTAEEQNLLADLVFLGIIPQNDVKTFNMVQYGELDNLMSEQDYSLPELSADADLYSSLDYFEKIQNVIDKTEQWSQWASNAAGSANITDTLSAQELVNSSKRLISGKQQILSILKNLSENASV